jgi:hypothetical protein
VHHPTTSFDEQRRTKSTDRHLYPPIKATKYNNNNGNDDDENDRSSTALPLTPNYTTALMSPSAQSANRGNTQTHSATNQHQ